MRVLGLFDVHRSQSVPASPPTPPPLTSELIELTDRLESLPPTGLDPAWLRERMRALLALCEVAPIVDEGPVDFMRHAVVADRPAQDPGQVDHIAGTVRSGYLWRGTVLRPQQVVAWTDPGLCSP